MNKIYLLTFLIFTSFFINAQDTQDTQEEVDPNIERVEKIQDLINRVEENREELSKIDAALKIAYKQAPPDFINLPVQGVEK